MKSLLLNIDKFIEDDKFTPEAIGNLDNWVYFSKLSELKKEIKDFFNQSTVSFEYANIQGVYDRIKAYIIQIQRLRLVIQPHFKLVKQIHLQERVYILVRADWVNDDGVRRRCVTKALCRVYPNKVQDISMKKAVEAIVPVLRKKYEESEEKFGILV
jgi:hypothetical protein